MMDEKELIARAFDEWMRRYIANPEEYQREFESVDAFRAGADPGKGSAYGNACAGHLAKLMAEIEAADRASVIAR